MKESYITNFIQIYIWKVLSLFLSFFSLFIVVPRISSEPSIYGVYMVCISTTMFLSYADIGFVGAGYKYSAECFARRDLDSEMEIQGFVSFVLAVFVSVFVLFYLTLSFRPDFLIKDLNNPVEFAIASKLLLIQAIFSYTTVFQRLNNAVFGIRLEDYIFQKIQIIGSIVIILSVFYFFKTNSYDIVGYFLFSKTITLATVLFGLILAKYRYGYSFRRLLRSFKFSKKIFKQTKDLAFASFYVTIMWILYYELDSIAIAKLLGAEAVACFAIGLTISKFFRNLISILYSPFMARFNHFVGINDLQGLNNLYLTAIKGTLPLVVFPVICILVLMEPIILSWVGGNYVASIRIALFLIFSNLFMFISVPTKLLIVALEKIKLLYIPNILMVVVYWGGIFLTYDQWKVESFAVFKLIALMIAALFYLAIAMQFLKINIFHFIKEVILPIVGPVVFLIISLMMMQSWLPAEKGKMNLLIVMFTGGGFSALALCLYYLISKDFKVFINNSVDKIMKKKIQTKPGDI